ncbi:MAG: hypothetical protein JWR80_1166 [Bradyrhizobium sp.]|nr:hypothetical protein [Bradyrhizobium sp.]
MDKMFRNVAAPEIVQVTRRFFRRSPAPVFRNPDKTKPAATISISVVVSAPHGISECLIPPNFFAAADGHSLELVVADASENYVNQSRPGLTHLNARGAGIFELIQTGLRCARNDWIFVVEDHGRPLPGLLDTYRAAIAAHPDVDLLFGGIDNMTSVSPWSFACFFYNKLDYWPAAGLAPMSPSLANLMVRRAAILPCELAEVGGFQFGSYPRLLAAGRLLYCPEAVVDHVRWFTLATAVTTNFHGARSVTAAAKASRGGRAAPQRLLRDGLVAAYGFTYLPWRIMRSLRGTPQGTRLMGLRVVAIGLARAAGMLWAHIAGAGNSAVKISADLAPK